MKNLQFNNGIQRALKKAQEGMRDEGTACVHVVLGTHDFVKYTLLAEPDKANWGGITGYESEDCLEYNPANNGAA